MTEHHLPDDLARWPEDPYEVLGVERPSDRSELRRAYTRLIRVFKPERAPEAFRRLRQAYEQTLAYADFHAQFEQGSFRIIREEAKPAELEAVATDAAGSNVEEPAAEDVPRPQATAQTRSVEEEAEETWCGWLDDAPTAYLRLLKMEERFTGSQDLCLRLYWMLRMRPQLDPQRRPCEWLMRGMRRYGFEGPFRELYRREVAQYPEQAISEAATELLLMQHSAGPMVDLAILRWRAAARLGQFSLIAKDLEGLRPRWREFPQTWLRLLLAGVDELAWCPDEKVVNLFNAYCREIDRQESIRLSDFDTLARFDLLRDLAIGFQRLANFMFVPDELRQLVARSWTCSLWELRTEAANWLLPLARQPRRFLEYLDRMNELCPGLVAQIGSVLGHLEMVGRSSGAAWPDDLLEDHVREMADQAPWGDYPQFRGPLVEFCVSEIVSPEQAAKALEQGNYWINANAHVAESIMADWPLRYACQAHRLLCGE